MSGPTYTFRHEAVFLMGARRRQNQAACSSSLAVLQPGAEILPGVANKVYNTLPMMQLELHHHRRMTFVPKSKSLPLTQEESLARETSHCHWTSSVCTTSKVCCLSGRQSGLWSWLGEFHPRRLVLDKVCAQMSMLLVIIMQTTIPFPTNRRVGSALTLTGY